MGRRACGVVVGAAVAILGLAPPEARAADLDVGAGQTYTTIQAAANAAQAGDVIRVHAGTYAEDLALDASGSSSTPITLEGGIDGDAIVSGRITLDGAHWAIRTLIVEPTTGRRGVRLRGDHNLLDDVEIRGGDNNGVDGSGTGNEIRNCRIHDLDSSSDAHCIVLNPGATDWIIADNELYDCAGDGVQLYSSGVERTIVNTRIENNSMYFTGAVQRTENAIDVKNADGLIITGNTTWGFPNQKNMVFQKGPANIHVECNVLHSGLSGVEFRGEDGGTVENVTFLRNLLHDFDEFALKFDGTVGAEVFNNTFVDAASDGLRIEGAGLASAVVQNNLWLRTGAVEAGSFTADHNGFFDVGTISIASGSDVNANPSLDGNYLLTAGSPMIDAGTDVGLPFSGTAPDLGFHEVGIDGCEPTGAGGSGTGGSSSGGSSSGGSGTAGSGNASSGGTGGTSSGAATGATPEEDGGCGCRVGGQGSTAPWLALLTAMVALGSVRRRRFR
ncbi:MAG: right-handed parallel beta-helix repeat-containing protein [Deltaproteobacteria bacterium]|jgi:MYXO-CTERM domain-containing protein|nr:right-handed parallel beta-helix repeat-containing protein [Deltaproteobacteria bacterium]MBW2535995.1 right-handed parallel beta-helix repeat-containing protein [Deltaproteobacteria bacterium]